MTKGKKRVYRKKRVVRTKRVSTAVKKYVKSTLSRTIENKTAQVNFTGSFGNILESPDMNMYPMLPYSGYLTIPQGVRQNERTGNEIKTKRVMLNYVLTPVEYNAISNPGPQPVEVQMFLGYTKFSPGELPIALDLSSLFQQSSSSIAPNGSLRDLISVVNTDYWHIAKRWTHKLGFASYTGTGGFGGSQFHANNDFKLNIVKRLDITKYCTKTIKFNDGVSTQQGKNLFFFYQAVASNGGIYPSTTQLASINFWVDYVFEDA